MGDRQEKLAARQGSKNRKGLLWCLLWITERFQSGIEERGGETERMKWINQQLHQPMQVQRRERNNGSVER